MRRRLLTECFTGWLQEQLNQLELPALEPSHAPELPTSPPILAASPEPAIPEPTSPKPASPKPTSPEPASPELMNAVTPTAS